MSDVREGPIDWTRWFEESADPSHWFYTAETLRIAADRLWNDWRDAHAEILRLVGADARAELPAEVWQRGRFGLPALLLSGYAIENVLKGIRITQWRKSGCSPIAEGKLDNYFKKHDLIGFANDAQIPLANAERQLLIRLEACVVWAGKYPIAKEAEPKELTQYGVGPHRVVTSDDQLAISLLYERLSEIFHSLE